MLSNIKNQNGVRAALSTAIVTAAMSVSAIGAHAADAALPVDLSPGSDSIARFVLYGQLNYGLMAADDGFDSEIMFVDNDNSSTRMGIEGSVPLTNWLKVGGKYEFEVEINSSAKVSLQTTNIGTAMKPRKFEGWAEVTIAQNVKVRVYGGLGSTASDGTSERDVSGTKVIGYSNTSALGSSIVFRNDATGALSGFKVGKVFSNLDGFSRDERVRVDAKLGPVTVAGSVINHERWDIAGFFKHTFNDVIKIAAAVSHGDDTRVPGAGFSQTSGSVSLLHIPSGVSVTGAAGMRDSDVAGRNDRTFLYGKLAIMRTMFTEEGKTGFAVDYMVTDDALTNNDRGRSFGIYAVQRIDRYNAELFAGYRQFDYERPGAAAFNAVRIFMTGARVKFKS